MKEKMHSYRDFVTREIRHTRGKFVGWVRGGPLGAWGAVFANRCSDTFIPGYCLTRDTRERITPEPQKV